MISEHCIEKCYRVLDTIRKFQSLEVTIKHTNMKLVIVTVVEEFQKDVQNFLKKQILKILAASDIDGYKTSIICF